MSHEEDAIRQLQTQALANYHMLVNAIAAIRQARERLECVQDNIEDAIRAANALAFACGAVVAEADRLADSVESAMLAAMQSTGACPVHTETHTITIRQNAAKVVIEDYSAVPEHMLAYPDPPQPRPDTAKCRKYLTVNKVNWGHIEYGGVSLVRRTRE